MDTLFSYIAKWSQSADAFAKVQAAYAFLAIILLIVAGFISLLDPRLGQTVGFFALISGLTLIANGVVWALVRTFVVPYLDKKYPAKSTRKK